MTSFEIGAKAGVTPDRPKLIARRSRNFVKANVQYPISKPI
jgi:hypothetical protein